MGHHAAVRHASHQHTIRVDLIVRHQSIQELAYERDISIVVVATAASRVPGVVQALEIYNDKWSRLGQLVELGCLLHPGRVHGIAMNSDY